mmetsp:Transcript_27165/g.91304  ORF Transcript_27165/g.91304 Transcript_27165/m.91304 type:complete len:211 (-) Transcript_27165:1875-2507(-)
MTRQCASSATGRLRSWATRCRGIVTLDLTTLWRLATSARTRSTTRGPRVTAPTRRTTTRWTNGRSSAGSGRRSTTGSTLRSSLTTFSPNTTLCRTRGTAAKLQKRKSPSRTLPTASRTTKSLSSTRAGGTSRTLRSPGRGGSAALTGPTTARRTTSTGWVKLLIPSSKKLPRSRPSTARRRAAARARTMTIISTTSGSTASSRRTLWPSV